MPKLSLIGKGALSGLEGLEELHISNNINLKDIHSAALTRKEEGAENDVWPPLKKVKYIQSYNTRRFANCRFSKLLSLVQMNGQMDPF